MSTINHDVAQRLRDAAIGRRDALAARAGFATWQEAIRATADLSQEAAGKVLGTTQGSVRNWREELGVATSSPALSFESKRQAFLNDATDGRHGTPNGYRNCRCRCSRCRAAWTEYLRGRRVEAQAREEAGHGTDARWLSCDCDRCVLARGAYGRAVREEERAKRAAAKAAKAARLSGVAA